MVASTLCNVACRHFTAVSAVARPLLLHDSLHTTTAASLLSLSPMTRMTYSSIAEHQGSMLITTNRARSSRRVFGTFLHDEDKASHRSFLDDQDKRVNECP
eukprot:3483518-Pyramimonas_sp.AAC.1